jgi:hypothetical protein
MLTGRSLEAFLTERRSQEAKNRIRKANDHTLHTPNQIYDYAVFELAIREFDIQSGWRDAYERQREYMRRDLFMGKINPEKVSQRLQDLNRYLDYIPIEKTNEKDRAFFGTWKKTLEIQKYRRPAEYVPPAVASRSAETDYCKNGWKDARQNK